MHDERAVTSVVAIFSSKCLVIFLMSLLDSVTVCLVDCGGAPYALSAFLVASMRKRPLGDVFLCHIGPTRMLYGPITHAGRHSGFLFEC